MFITYLWHRSFQEYFAALYTTQLDDSQQKRFLKLWLQNNSYRTTSNYLDMLYELQHFLKNCFLLPKNIFCVIMN